MKEEDTRNPSNLIASTEMEAVTRKLATNASPGPDGFTGDRYQTVRTE